MKKYDTSDFVKLTPICGYTIKYTKKFGRGVYAARMIPSGHKIVTNNMVVGNTGGEIASRYAYDAGHGFAGIALGDISLVNHSIKPNCYVETVYDKGRWPRATLVAAKQIKKGQQLFVDYGYDPVEQDKRRRDKKKQFAGRLRKRPVAVDGKPNLNYQVVGNGTVL